MDKVEDERIWVTDLDTVTDLEEEIFDYVNYVVNLSSWCDSQWAHDNRYAHISIPDGEAPAGGEINYTDFALACDLVYEYLEREDKGHILVHCAAGISRSVSVASAVLSRRNDTSVCEEVERVMEARNNGLDPHPTNISYAEKWVKENR